jgi:hypothetical protein
VFKKPATDPYPEPDESSSHLHPTPLIYTLILLSHLSLGPPSSLFLSDLRTKILHTLLFSPGHATCLTHIILLGFIIRIMVGEERKWRSFSLRNFLQPLIISPLSGLNIVLGTLFSNSLSLRSSHNAWDRVLHPYQTTRKITVLYILFFTFTYSRMEERRFWTECEQVLPNLICS